MKKIILALALASAFPAFAQDSTSSGTASSNSTSNPIVTSGNSSSSVDVGSTSVANPNNSAQQMIQLNTYAPDHQSSDYNSNSRSTSESINRNISEGTSTQRVEYSGTQTVKNVPGIQMSGPASGPCTGASGGVGLAGPGWGVGFNGSGVMADCRLRENTRVLGMAMQSLDGGANPQEKGEVTVLFMNAVRGLAAYNDQILGEEIKGKK